MDILRPLVVPLTPAPVRPVALSGGALPVSPPQAAAIAIGAIGPQQANGSVPVDYTTDKATGALAVLYPETTPTPAAGQFGGADPAYGALGTVSLTVDGPSIQLTLPSGLLGNFKIALLPTGGGDADVAESPVVTVDTTAPALASASFADDGSEGISWSFTTDEDASYRVSLWPSGTNPSAAEIESGSGAIATVTGTSLGGTAETGAFPAVGAGIYQPTIWVQDNFSNEATQTYADVTVAAASGAASVTINSIGPQQANGSVPVDYTTDKATGAQVVLYPEATPKPLASQFGGADPAYTNLGTVSLTVDGSNIPLTLPDGLLGNYRIALLPTGGSDADVAESVPFALDTTAPALSGVSFADSGSEGISWAFTSDEAGTYRVSIWPQDTDPTAAEIKSGTGALATITGACSGGVEETGALAALGAGTYQPTIWVQDSFANETAQTFADVTVAAAAQYTHEINDPAQTVTSPAGAATITIPNVTLTAGNKIVIVRKAYSGVGTAAAINGAPTWGANTASAFQGVGSISNSKHVQAFIFHINVTAGGTNDLVLPVNITFSQSSDHFVLLDVFDVPGFTAVAGGAEVDYIGASSFPLAADTAANGMAFAAAVGNSSTASFTFTNATALDQDDIHPGSSTMRTGLALNDLTPAATSLKFDVTSDGAINRCAATVMTIAR